MDKIDRIISAYECGETKTPGERCKRCPYGYGKLDETGDNAFWWCNTDRLEQDAINLLKIIRAVLE